MYLKSDKYTVYLLDYVNATIAEQQISTFHSHRTQKFSQLRLCSHSQYASPVSLIDLGFFFFEGSDKRCSITDYFCNPSTLNQHKKLPPRNFCLLHSAWNHSPGIFICMLPLQTPLSATANFFTPILLVFYIYQEVHHSSLCHWTTCVSFSGKGVVESVFCITYLEAWKGGSRGGSQGKRTEWYNVKQTGHQSSKNGV